MSFRCTRRNAAIANRACSAEDESCARRSAPRRAKASCPTAPRRFSFKGKPIAHYMGCSTFANYTVLPEIALAKVRDDAPFEKICYIGCGVTTGVGAVIYTAKVAPGDNVVVFGLGGIGSERHSGRTHCRRRYDYRCRHQSRAAVSLATKVRHDAFCQSEGDQRAISCRIWSS